MVYNLVYYLICLCWLNVNHVYELYWKVAVGLKLVWQCCDTKPPPLCHWQQTSGNLSIQLIEVDNIKSTYTNKIIYKVIHHYQTDTNDCFVLFCITLYCTVSDSCDFVLHYIYIYIVSPIIVSNLIMAKSEMAETCSWCEYLSYTYKYSCVMTDTSMHKLSLYVQYTQRGWHDLKLICIFRSGVTHAVVGIEVKFIMFFFFVCFCLGISHGAKVSGPKWCNM